MHISEKGLDLIKRFEGLGDGDRHKPGLQPYKDPVGIWTIGYGHTGNLTVMDHQGLPVTLDITNPDTTITKEQAEWLLQKDIVRYENYVKNQVNQRITQEMFDALVSFTYNLGSGNLKRLIRTRLKLGRYTATADAMLLYDKAGGQKLRGLTRRRNEEREMFLSTFQFPQDNG